MDFTLKTYHHLLDALQSQGYSFQTFGEFLKHPEDRVVILRHDVDRLPGNALVFARIQHARGIRRSYYFRVVPQSWDEAVMREISGLGHEVGYHYETMEQAGKGKGEVRNTKYEVRSEVGSWKEEGGSVWRRVFPVLRKPGAVSCYRAG